MSWLRFLAAHWAGTLTTLVLLSMGIIILQNVEPVQFDVLFWSFPALPKLVVILVSMALGALLAEVARFLLRGRPSAAKPPDPGLQ